MDETLQKLLKITKNLDVIYVEDNKIAREETKEIFKNFFKDVKTASNGAEGLELFKNKNTDLIISDINMPEMNGLEMVKRIKMLNSDVGVILISAYNETEYFTEAIRLGVDGFILKPLELESFIDTLYQIVKKMIVKKQAEEFENLLKQYQNIVDKSSLVVKFDKTGKITYANEEFCKTFEYSQDEIIDKKIEYIFKNVENNEFSLNEILNNVLKEKKTLRKIIKCHTKKGKILYIKSVISPIIDENGEILELISMCYDVSEMMKPKKLLYDFIENSSEPMVVLIEMENFQSFRNYFGEKMSEKIEHKFEEYLFENLPLGFKKIFDLDDGEYAVVLDLAQSNKLYEEYIKDLKKFQKKVNYTQLEIGDLLYDVTVILSVSKGKNAFEDVRIGMSKIKSNKDSFINAYGLLQNEKKSAKENIQMLHILKEAIENKKIICFYQPIIDNKTKKIVKYETLVRIEHNNEIIPPYKFIEIAKQGVYYSKITESVLNEAFKIIKKIKNYDISINISEIDIEKEIVRELIYETLHKNKEYAKFVTFELLEDANVEKYDVLEEFITKIKELGVTIAIDDFGSGYSNFVRLINYKPDFLKLDGSLIKNIHTDKFSYSVVKSIVEFAKANEIKTIAEFVENEEIFNIVKELGVDYSQGYYFGKPERPEFEN